MLKSYFLKISAVFSVFFIGLIVIALFFPQPLILLPLALLVFVVVCWNIPQIASALTGGGAIQGSMRTVYNMARGGLRKAGNTTEKGVNKVRSRFGKSGGGNIKKT